MLFNFSLLPEEGSALGEDSCGTVTSCCCEVVEEESSFFCDGKTLPVLERADCACHGGLAQSTAFLKIHFELSFSAFEEVVFKEPFVLSSETKQKTSFVSSLERPPRHSFLSV